MFHSDQGTTYTASSHLGLLAKNRILHSMTELKAILNAVTRIGHIQDTATGSLQRSYGKAKIRRGDLLDPTTADFSSELGDSLELT